MAKLCTGPICTGPERRNYVLGQYVLANAAASGRSTWPDGECIHRPHPGDCHNKRKIMFAATPKLVEGDRVVITGGNHIRRVGTVAKVLPRSYHIIFDTREKPGEKSPSCIRSWNVKKETSTKKEPTNDKMPPHATSVDLPKRKKKWVETVSSEAIAQVMLPVLKGMSSLTKEEWAVIALAVDNLFD